MEKKKNVGECLVSAQKGITLIALIITVIVLLILAGVTINLTIGENGIFQTAQRAAEEHKIGAAKEKLVLAVAEYEVKMRKETMYNILNKVEGLQSIEPNDEQAGVPYTVVVDGYEFLITEELEVIYEGKANVIVPEIISITKNVISEEEVKISIQSKTKDAAGIGKLVLIKNGVEIETREVSGTDVAEEFSITGNGKYQVKVEGYNKKIVVSEEIEVTEMTRISGTLQAGTVIDGSVLLTVTGEVVDGTISKVEIYEGTTKIKEIAYTEPKTQIEEEYQVEYMSFYEEKNYSAKLITTSTSANTNEVQVKNIDTIKTAKDLNNLATAVNSGITYSGETITLIGDITTTENYVPIGYNNGTDYNSPGFSGTFEGEGHSITISSITTESKYWPGGIFGYVKGGIVNNLTVKGTNNTAKPYSGGIVGAIKDGKITNCTNQCAILDETQSYKGGIAGIANNSEISGCINIATVYGYSSVGGICGIIENNTKVTECTNLSKVKAVGYESITAKINGSTTTESIGLVGGIVGKCDLSQVEKCINNSSAISYTGNVKSFIGGIVGWATNNSKIKLSKNLGKITCGNFGLGGIIGGAVLSDITECYNNAIVSGITVNASGQEAKTAKNCGGIIGYGVSIKLKNCHNMKKVEGAENIGGIAGILQYDGTTINIFNNSYNASAEITGNINVGSNIGLSENTTCSYNSAVELEGFGPIGSTVNTILVEGTNLGFTQSEMSTTNSLLNLLNQGDGVGVWARLNSINNGYPYLVNNKP